MRASQQLRPDDRVRCGKSVAAFSLAQSPVIVLLILMASSQSFAQQIRVFTPANAAEARAKAQELIEAFIAEAIDQVEDEAVADALSQMARRWLETMRD